MQRLFCVCVCSRNRTINFARVSVSVPRFDACRRRNKVNWIIRLKIMQCDRNPISIKLKFELKCSFPLESTPLTNLSNRKSWYIPPRYINFATHSSLTCPISFSLSLNNPHQRWTWRMMLVSASASQSIHAGVRLLLIFQFRTRWTRRQRFQPIHRTAAAHIRWPPHTRSAASDRHLI